MGVEYKHFLIPTNPSFVPGKDVFRKIDAVLNKWNLKTGEPEFYDVTEGAKQIVRTPLENLNFHHGIVAEYPEVSGEAVVTIMGESYFHDEIDDEDRYFQGLTFIAGLDYRVHPSSQELNISVTQAPIENDSPIEPYCEIDEDFYGLHAEAYSCSLSTLAPIVSVKSVDAKRIIGDQAFFGFWRTAFAIDCGKDLPKLGSDIYKIKNQDFINDFENALGCTVVEIGEVY